LSKIDQGVTVKAERVLKRPQAAKASRKPRRAQPAVLIKDGKPAFVVLDIRDYRDILDKLDDLEDIQYVDRLVRKRPRFRPFEEFLAERPRR
jgi:hypothetical protein